MPDDAAKADSAPPPDDAAPEPDAQADEPTTDWEAKATDLSKRFSGSQKALNEALAREKKLAEERDALATYKAQTERSSMSEIEAAKADAETARQEAAAARAEADRERKARQFPLAVEFYGDEPLPSEEKLAALQARLAAAAPDDETELPPRIDPNNPRRPSIAPRGDKSGDELERDLRGMPVPWG